MSFIGATKQGRGFEAGYFLESEVGVVRKTRQIKADGAKTIGTEKYVLAGTLYTNGDEKGIVYEDVNVTNGDMPGSVVLAGRVYSDRLPSKTVSGITSNTSIKVIGAAPAVTRPTSAPVISASGEVKTSEGGTITLKSDKPFKSDVKKDDFSVDMGNTSGSVESVTYKTGDVEVKIQSTSSEGDITLQAKASAFEDSLKDSNTVKVHVSSGE